MDEPIYLDYNATTPIDPEVAEAMTPYLYNHFGNPSSNHIFGTTALMAVEEGRHQVAALLNCSPDEIIFTSGGTESNNHAIRGTVLNGQNRPNAVKQPSQIITSAVEHPAVIEVCRWLSDQGWGLTILPVDRHGLVDPADLKEAITGETLLVSVMHANNEVGTIQPIQELAAITHAHGAIFHTDAAQSVGKIPVDVKALGVDLLSIAGHKLYAPKGIGALYIRQGVPLRNLMFGAGHEKGRRPGTENVLEISGLGAACQITSRDLGWLPARLQELRDKLQTRLLMEAIGEENIRIHGHPVNRLPNTLSLSIHGLDANTFVAEASDRLAVSTGSACHAGQVTMSPVLEAMRVPPEWAMGTLRFSVGRGTTEEQIDRAVEIVAEGVVC